MVGFESLISLCFLLFVSFVFVVLSFFSPIIFGLFVFFLVFHLYFFVAVLTFFCIFLVIMGIKIDIANFSLFSGNQCFTI